MRAATAAPCRTRTPIPKRKQLNVRLGRLHTPSDPFVRSPSTWRCQAAQSGDDQQSGPADDDQPLAPQDRIEAVASGAAELADDNVEAEQIRREEFVKDFFQSKYDPMFHGKWVDIQGAQMKMPDYDFSEYEWMSRVPTDIGWPMFWEHFEELTETDDEYTEDCETVTASGRMALHSSQKRARAFEAQTLLAGAPDFIAPGLEGTVKDEIPPATIVDRDRTDVIDAWELRARREKEEARKERDYHWQVTQAMEHWQMLNHPPEDQTDVRIMEKIRAERYDWTDEEIWDVVTNQGRSVDPFVMLNAPTFKTLNPLSMPDYASQGIEYVDDMEDWISQQGRWMSQDDYANLPQGSDSDDEEEADIESWDEDEDPLYEDLEGGDAGISDPGEVSVRPDVESGDLGNTFGMA